MAPHSPDPLGLLLAATIATIVVTSALSLLVSWRHRRAVGRSVRSRATGVPVAPVPVRPAGRGAPPCPPGTGGAARHGAPPRRGEPGERPVAARPPAPARHRRRLRRRGTRLRPGRRGRVARGGTGGDRAAQPARPGRAVRLATPPDRAGGARRTPVDPRMGLGRLRRSGPSLDDRHRDHTVGDRHARRARRRASCGRAPHAERSGRPSGRALPRRSGAGHCDRAAPLPVDRAVGGAVGHLARSGHGARGARRRSARRRRRRAPGAECSAVRPQARGRPDGDHLPLVAPRDRVALGRADPVRDPSGTRHLDGPPRVPARAGRRDAPAPPPDRPAPPSCCSSAHTAPRSTARPFSAGSARTGATSAPSR